VVIEEGVTIGDDTVLYPQVVIRRGVVIGRNCVIHPQVTIYPDVRVGDRVILHAGVVLGSDGFGYLRVGNHHYKIPQVGQVIIGDDVEIGANSTVDRSTTGQTRVDRGTKLDNLVHVAHNVHIGEDCAVAALVGVSGSVSIGSRSLIAGQAGFADHVSVGSDSVVAARAGVIGDYPDQSFVSGFPARPHREEMRLQASLRQIPKLLQTIKELKRQVDALEQEQNSKG
jgi:UDP-3-O-[3-hydroxymyristoyl] glucosamine N-acyltransferase